MSKEKTFTLFITGLCLQGNKGGSAIAISMREALKKELKLDEITLSVPGGVEFKHEEIAALKHGFDVVEAIGLKDIMPPFCFFRGRLSRAKSWLNALRSADVVIDMTAISYVGPPIGSLNGILGGRFFYFMLSMLLRKPFLAWTQSYGPLSTPLIRLLARWDLGRQTIVFCRGEDCADTVKHLLPNKDIRSFPDVATILPYFSEFGAKVILQKLGDSDRTLITISPSAVIYTKTSGILLENKHVQHIANLCGQMIKQGYNILLVPHTLRKENVVAGNCDLEVCKLITVLVDDFTHMALIDEDYGANELKGIIANAEIHIGGRYHSVVAALSSGVPCISLSWHPKYKDLMRAYGLEKYVFDAVKETDIEPLIHMTNNLVSRRSSLHSSLQKQQEVICSQIEENSKLFSQNL